MNRNMTISQRLREVLLNGHWIANTNYKELIESVNWEQATTKISSLNTIAELTFHINYYLEGLNSAFETGRLEISDKYSFAMPNITTESDWQALVKQFLKNSELFIEKVESMPNSAFDEPFMDPKYGTYLRNIEGVIEHSYYHLGQISLVRKLIIERH